MRLASFLSPAGAGFGLVEGDRVFDLAARLGCPDLRTALARGALQGVAAELSAALADYRADEIRYLPVIPNPSKIVCAGLNYLAHRLEGNHRPEAAAPPLFLRVAESQVGHGEPMIRPVASEQFDFEAEVAVIIGKGGRRIPESEAYAHVAGLSCYNDGSVRDWQLATPQWTPGKNFPATGAFGPWMVTPDELPPDSVLTLSLRLNGVEMQRTTTDLMMFTIPQLISHISAFTPLSPGDVVVTGTPGGVGLRRDPPVWMRPGDLVEVELEGVGILRNSIVAEEAMKMNPEPA
jgi:2-keto-4-pentenoate hydratase/2-oxohepta-3-ene-1,7-dioic acid hydratase in catechol pathway